MINSGEQAWINLMTSPRSNNYMHLMEQNKIPNKCSSVVQMERESKDIRTTTEKYKATVSKDVK